MKYLKKFNEIKISDDLDLAKQDIEERFIDLIDQYGEYSITKGSDIHDNIVNDFLVIRINKIYNYDLQTIYLVIKWLFKYSENFNLDISIGKSLGDGLQYFKGSEDSILNNINDFYNSVKSIQVNNPISFKKLKPYIIIRLTLK